MTYRQVRCGTCPSSSTGSCRAVERSVRNSHPSAYRSSRGACFDRSRTSSTHKATETIGFTVDEPVRQTGPRLAARPGGAIRQRQLWGKPARANRRWVLNPAAFMKWMAAQRDSIPAPDLHLAATHLEQYVRSHSAVQQTIAAR